MNVIAAIGLGANLNDPAAQTMIPGPAKATYPEDQLHRLAQTKIDEMPDRFGWVPGWLIVFPLLLPLVGICYLIWGLGGSCRVCGQGLFRHSAHLKNKRAHHMPVLGYIFPLCIQILLFHWFRCTHCGTPVRLKE